MDILRNVIRRNTTGLGSINTTFCTVFNIFFFFQKLICICDVCKPYARERNAFQNVIPIITLYRSLLFPTPLLYALYHYTYIIHTVKQTHALQRFSRRGREMISFNYTPQRG